MVMRDCKQCATHRLRTHRRRAIYCINIDDDARDSIRYTNLMHGTIPNVIHIKSVGRVYDPLVA